MAIIIRMSYEMQNHNVHHMHVSSAQRNSGTSSSFNVSLKIPDMGFNKVAIVKAAIPRSWLLIDIPFNTFILVENGVNTTITVPPGNYNIRQWATQISALMTTHSPNHWTYTATVLLQNGTITWSVTGNAGQPSFIIEEMSKQMCMARGTHTFVGNSLPGVIPFSATGIIGLQICSDISTVAHTSVLSEIYSVGETAPGSIMVTELQDFLASAVSYQHHPGVSGYNFYLRNPENGRSVDLRGHDWLMHLVCWKSEVHKPEEGKTAVEPTKPTPATSSPESVEYKR